MMYIEHAKNVALGRVPAVSLEEYYTAWQVLYDRRVPLSEPDERFMDKLICDGAVLTKDNRQELNEIPQWILSRRP